MSDTASPAKTAACRGCGSTFELPSGRGRPPVKCLPCRMYHAGPTAHVAGATATVTALCVKCTKPFERPVRRGRPNTACPACRADKPAPVVEATEVVAGDEADDTVHTFVVGDFVRLKAGAYAADPDGRDAFVITGVKLAADGTVKYYDAFGGDATDPEGVRMMRAFAPAKLRPENRKNVAKHRHHPGAATSNDGEEG